MYQKKLIFLLTLFLPFCIQAKNDTLFLSDTPILIEEIMLLDSTFGVDQLSDIIFNGSFTNLNTVTQTSSMEFWLYFKVKNTKAVADTWMLNYYLGWPHIKMYIKEGHQIDTLTSGFFSEKKEKAFICRGENYLPLTLEAGHTKEIFIHLKRTDFFPVKNNGAQFHIRTKEQSLAKEARLFAIIMFFNGIFFVMFFYNFFLGLITKNTNYFLYIAVILFYGTQIYGFNFTYAYPYFTEVMDFIHIASIISISGAIFMMLFVKKFLKTSTYLPFWDKVLTFFIFANILSFLPALFGNIGLTYMISALLGILYVFTILIIAVKSYLRKVPSAGIFLVAQGFFLLGWLLNMLITLKLAPFNDFTSIIPPAFTLIQLVLFSFALANRINHLQKNLHRINAATDKFVPYEFIRALGKESITEVKLGDHVEREVTVLFSDIRDYTSFAENISPTDTFSFVTAYSKMMGPIIENNNGFINQYMGDGIMAIFLGNPADAIRASIEMQNTLVGYNLRRIAKNRKVLEIGIGLHTGNLIMGIIGDNTRNANSTISDAVNTASRMEGLSKFFGAPIIVSGDSIKKIDNLDDFKYRFIGKVQLKGKQKAKDIYEFFATDNMPLDRQKLATAKLFSQALEKYLATDFQAALTDFATIIQKFPEDKTPVYYQQQCLKYLKEGVPDNWAGIELMNQK